VEIAPSPATVPYPASLRSKRRAVAEDASCKRFSDDQWETFVEEWASSLKMDYFRVARSGGAGDKGLDVMCFATAQLFCRRVGQLPVQALRPPTYAKRGWIEIGKLVYYTHIGEYTLPRKFTSPVAKVSERQLSRLLNQRTGLQAKVARKMEASCQRKSS